MSLTVHSPVPGYTGTVAGVVFVDGQASLYDDDYQALAYFRRHGYGIGQPAEAKRTVLPDPRDLAANGEPVGSRLRDAAVDPEPEDFLPPINAGQANPHGPEVVAPGLHATPPGPIVPGLVSPNPDEQSAIESAAADGALVQQVPVPEVTAALAEVQGQPTAATTAQPTKTTRKARSPGK